MKLQNIVAIYLVTFFSFFVFGVAYAKDMQIDMLNKLGKERMVYSIDVAKVNAGDTVTWLPKDKGHNVEFISIPDGVDKIKKSKLNKEFAYKFTVPGIYLYQCTPHKSMGMIGLIVVDGNVNNKKKIAKAKVFGKSKKKLKKLLGEL